MSRTGDHVLEALAVTLWPSSADAFAPTVRRSRALEARMPRLYRWVFRVALLVIAVSPLFLLGRPRLFHQLRQDLRDRCLHKIVRSRSVYPRALLVLVRAVLCLSQYDRPRSERAVGWTPLQSGYGDVHA